MVVFEWTLLFITAFIFLSAVIAGAFTIIKYVKSTRKVYDIKPCPHCGSDAVIESTKTISGGKYYPLVSKKNCQQKWAKYVPEPMAWKINGKNSGKKLEI